MEVAKSTSPWSWLGACPMHRRRRRCSEAVLRVRFHTREWRPEPSGSYDRAASSVRSDDACLRRMRNNREIVVLVGHPQV